MANSRQARKRARQAETHRSQNAAKRSEMRTAIKKIRSAITTGNKEAAASAYTSAVPVIDKMVNKGILHRNAADRFKSRLNAHVKRLDA